MRPYLFKIGGFELRIYSLMYILAFLFGMFIALADDVAEKRGVDDRKIIEDFAFTTIVSGLIGARLYYVIFKFDYYSQHLGEVFAVWNGGLAIYGGLITGAIVLYFFSQQKFINTLDFLDIAVPGVMIAQSIGRWGNFINQEAYGATVKSLDYLPGFIRDQMYIDGAYRQPTFLYESTWNLLGFILILFLRRKPNFLKQGDITAFYLIWYGCGRMIIEGMRTDSLYFMGLRVSQWLSALLIILGVALVVYQHRKKDTPYYYTSLEMEKKNA